jgi:hypothetical protein
VALSGEPSAWNKYSAVSSVLDALPGESTSAHVVGGYHADPEDEVTLLTRAVRSSAGHCAPDTFQILLRAYLCGVWRQSAAALLPDLRAFSERHGAAGGGLRLQPVPWGEDEAGTGAGQEVFRAVGEVLGAGRVRLGSTEHGAR